MECAGRIFVSRERELVARSQADSRAEVDSARARLAAISAQVAAASASLEESDDDDGNEDDDEVALIEESEDDGEDDGGEDDGGDDGDSSTPRSRPSERSSIREQREITEDRTLGGGLNSGDAAVMENYFGKRQWFTQHLSRAQLFFGIVPGHDDPELEAFPTDTLACCLPPMISPTSNFRVAWDMLIAIFLLYILLIEPLSLGFLEDRVMRWGTPLGVINRIVDVVFILDLMLNFRTGYVNRHKELVMDPAASRREYLRSWFLLDIVSTMPPVLELAIYASTGGAKAVDTSVVKLLRVLKITKLMRLVKLVKLTDRDSAFVDSVEDFLASSSSMFALRCMCMVSLSFILAHLLACFMAASGPGWLKTYDPDPRDAVGGYGQSPQDWYWFRQYIVSFYWAFTTMTSVGYGDVTPQSDAERVYAIFAMMIGVAFYSYIIATVASMVTAADAKSVIYFERMDQLSSWMRHYRFEMSLRRRTRRFFKQFYAVRSAIDERSILENLAPQLQEAVSSYLLHTFVKKHPLFRNLPEGTLWKVLTIVRTIQFEPDALIISTGSPSSALFVLRTGACTCTLPAVGVVNGPGAPRTPPARSRTGTPKRSPAPAAAAPAAAAPGDAPPSPGTKFASVAAAAVAAAAAAADKSSAFAAAAAAAAEQSAGATISIGPGSSFGELCLLGTRSSSLVTVRTVTPCEFFLVQRDAFLDSFANLPEILEGMIDKRTLFLKKPVRLPPKARARARSAARSPVLSALRSGDSADAPRVSTIRFVSDEPATRGSPDAAEGGPSPGDPLGRERPRSLRDVIQERVIKNPSESPSYE